LIDQPLNGHCFDRNKNKIIMLEGATHIVMTLQHLIFLFLGVGGRDKFSPLSDGKKSNATHTKEFCGKKKSVPKSAKFI
jgi:hypothetical protein